MTNRTIESKFSEIYDTYFKHYEGRPGVRVSQRETELTWQRTVCFGVEARFTVDTEYAGRASEHVGSHWWFKELDADFTVYRPKIRINTGMCSSVDNLTAFVAVCAEMRDMVGMIRAAFGDYVFISQAALDDREEKLRQLAEAPHAPGCSYDAEPEAFGDNESFVRRFPDSRCSCGVIKYAEEHEAGEIKTQGVIRSGSVVLPVVVTKSSPKKVTCRVMDAISLAPGKYRYGNEYQSEDRVFRLHKDGVWRESGGEATFEFGLLSYRPQAVAVAS